MVLYQAVCTLFFSWHSFHGYGLINFKQWFSTEITKLLGTRQKQTLERLVKKTLDEMKVTPFMNIAFRGQDLAMNGTETGQCKETSGDCDAFIKKYLKI